MKILVLNGSPKGDISVTMQYVKYMEMKFSNHQFKVANIAKDIKKLENNEQDFTALMEEVKAADGILWAFPLYVYLVHGSYKRFIELIWERGATELFKNKYTAALSTSIHFFDNTAHDYIRGICDDLHMRYTGFFSAEMQDLLKEKSRSELDIFTGDFIRHMEKSLPTSRAYQAIQSKVKPYAPGEASRSIDNRGKKVLVVTDAYNKASNQGKMIDYFTACFRDKVDVVNISEINMLGGCLGCLKCGIDNICVYDGKDDVRSIYEERIKAADIVVFAGTIVDRYLSARWKTFIDRRFFNTHQPTLSGKQVGYLISGPMGQLQNLREILHAVTELDQANLVDIVTDEYEDDGQIDLLLETLGARLVEMAEAGYRKPVTFLGVGGVRIFRDEIWGKLRMVFQGDHRYYKKNGIYDFPHNKISTRMMNFFMMPITRIPSVKKGMQQEMTKFMIQPYQNTLKNLKR